MTAEPHPDAYNIHDAKTNLSRIIDRVEHGKFYPQRTGRGSLAGQLRLADDWDTPSVNDAIARDFGLAPQ